MQWGDPWLSCPTVEATLTGASRLADLPSEEHSGVVADPPAVTVVEDHTAAAAPGAHLQIVVAMPVQVEATRAGVGIVEARVGAGVAPPAGAEVLQVDITSPQAPSIG